MKLQRGIYLQASLVATESRAYQVASNDVCAGQIEMSGSVQQMTVVGIDGLKAVAACAHQMNGINRAKKNTGRQQIDSLANQFQQ